MLPSLGRGLMPVMAAGLALLAGDALLTENGDRLVTHSGLPLIPETAPPGPEADDLGLLTEDGRLLIIERADPALLLAGPDRPLACEDLTLLIVETS